jgi:hypothetical protein
MDANPIHSVRFKRIRNDKDISEKEGFGTQFITSIILVGLHIFALVYFQVPISLITCSLLLFAFAFRPLTRRLYPDWARKKDIIGEVYFDSNEVKATSVNEEITIDLKQINTLAFSYNYIQGKQFSTRDILHNGMAQMVFTYTSGEKQELKWLIENKKQLDAFKPILKAYYLLGINIQERMGKYSFKTILFDAELTHAKIQMYKKELNQTHFD